MILVDSSVWIDHFREGNGFLDNLLQGEKVLTHPFVIGELVMGSLRDRHQVIFEIMKLPRVVVAKEREVLAMVENFKLYSRGIGYLDAHLLASARLAREPILWTRDRRLRAVAMELEVAADLPGMSLQ